MKLTALPVILVLGALLAAGVGAKPGVSKQGPVKPSYEETVFDFGHVGIDFTVYHRWPLVNRTPDTVRIRSVVAHCDCSSAFAVDSVLAPGDSTVISLRFNTKNFYGPQNKSVTVSTDHPELGEIDYFYLSIIGQWINGVRPEPISAFFLPGQKSKTVAIPNPSFGRMRIGDMRQYDDKCMVKLVKSEAGKNESLQIEITSADDLQRGTFHTNLTLKLECDDIDPIILTIPVKIVRY